MVLKKLSSYSCAQEINQQQAKFSEKLASEIQTTAREASSSVDTLDVQNALDKETLLSESNYFASDLNRIVFNLQNFALKLDDASTTKSQLLQIIGKIVETSYGVQHSFNIDPSVLKIKLKASVDQLSGESNDVAQLLLKEQVPDNKQRLLDVLNDMLSASDKIKIRNQIRKEPPKALQVLLDEAVNGVWNGLDSFNLDDEVVLHHIVHYIRHGVNHMQRVVHYLHIYGHHYEGNTYEVFSRAGDDLHKLLVILQDTFQTTKSVSEMKSSIRLNVHAGCGQMGKLATLRDTKNNQGTNTLQEAVDVLITDTLANSHQLARGLLNSRILN